MKTLLRFLSVSAIIFAPFFTLYAASGLVPCDGPECDLCSLVALAHTLMNFLVLACSLIATLMFTWAGFLYLTNADNPGKRSEGGKIFTNVFIGFIALLAAWLIIDTVMKVLFTYDNGLQGTAAYGQPWQNILCSYRSQTPPPTDQATGNTTAGNTTAGGSTAGGTTAGAGGGTHLSQTVAFSLLNQSGIAVHSSGNCSDPNVSTCTSLEGMRAGTVSGVINLSQQACGQSGGCVIVTGGTETGHETGTCSHANGCKADVQPNPLVDGYIMGLTQIGNRAGDNAAQYQDACGNVYAREDTHWDISFPSGQVPGSSGCH